VDPPPVRTVPKAGGSGHGAGMTPLVLCHGCAETFTSNRAAERHRSGPGGCVCLSPDAVGLVPTVPADVNVIAWALPGPGDDKQIHD
jgi:hypothetical protein